MVDILLFSQLSVLAMFMLLMLFFGDVRNARGMFAMFMVSGAVLPFVLSYLFGLESRIAVMPLTGPEGTKAATLCVVALGLTIYTSIVVERRYLALKPSEVYRPSATVANVFSWLTLLSVGTYVTAMTWRLGGLTEMVVRLYQRVSLFDSVANYLTLISFASMVFAVFSFSFARGSGNRRAVWLSYCAVSVCFAETAMLGGRSFVILFVLALFYVTLTRISLAKFVVASIVLLAFSAVTSSVMISARSAAQTAAIETDRPELAAGRHQESFLSLATTGVTFVDHVAASIAYVEQRGHDFGESYLNIIFLPIPRDLWPAKPFQISSRMREFLFGDLNGGEPPGLFGEAYIAFGSAGVVLAAIVLGWLIGRVNATTALARRTNCRAREACAGLLAPLIAYGLVRGGFDIAALRIGIPALWCLVSMSVVRRIVRRQRTRNAVHSRASARRGNHLLAPPSVGNRA